MANSKADDLKAALVADGRVGSIADASRLRYLFLMSGSNTRSWSDLRRERGDSKKHSHLDVPLV